MVVRTIIEWICIFILSISTILSIVYRFLSESNVGIIISAIGWFVYLSFKLCSKYRSTRKKKLADVCSDIRLKYECEYGSELYNKIHRHRATLNWIFHNDVKFDVDQTAIDNESESLMIAINQKSHQKKEKAKTEMIKLGYPLEITKMILFEFVTDIYDDKEFTQIKEDIDKHPNRNIILEIIGESKNSYICTIFSILCC